MNKLLFVIITFLTLTVFPWTMDEANAVFFSDNFNTGASPLWGNEAGGWYASGGVYNAQSPSNNPLTYSSLPYDLTDFVVDLDINNVSDGGIFLRSSRDSNTEQSVASC